MPKIVRKAQKIFASTAVAGEIGQIGSFAAGSPAYTTDPDTIQSLSNYLQGWFGVVVAQNSPAIQDMNALDFLITRQLAYLFQTGIPEWNSETTYYFGSWAADSAGNVYISLTNDNLANALTSTSNWKPLFGFYRYIDSGASPYSLGGVDKDGTFFVDTTTGSFIFVLPAPELGYTVTIKDSGGVASTNIITVARNSGELIEGTAADYLCQSDYGSWKFVSDGTNWFII